MLHLKVCKKCEDVWKVCKISLIYGFDFTSVNLKRFLVSAAFSLSEDMT
jgi:hypothetical protein